MVSVNMELSLRGRQREEALARVRDMKGNRGVRVLPRDDKMRKILRHPSGQAFRSEGSVEWPNDRFTKRRLAEGSVTLEKAGDNPGDKPGDKPVEKPQPAPEPPAPPTPTEQPAQPQPAPEPPTE